MGELVTKLQTSVNWFSGVVEAGMPP